MTIKDSFIRKEKKNVFSRISDSKRNKKFITYIYNKYTKYDLMLLLNLSHTHRLQIAKMEYKPRGKDRQINDRWKRTQYICIIL